MLPKHVNLLNELQVRFFCSQAVPIFRQHVHVIAFHEQGDYCCSMRLHSQPRVPTMFSKWFQPPTNSRLSTPCKLRTSSAHCCLQRQKNSSGLPLYYLRCTLTPVADIRPHTSLARDVFTAVVHSVRPDQPRHVRILSPPAIQLSTTLIFIKGTLPKVA